jgi:hypothetical protein
MLGLVADEDFDTEFFEPLGIIAVGRIGTLDFVAEVMQHFGDTAHANAADADEMQHADIER